MLAKLKETFLIPAILIILTLSVSLVFLYGEYLKNKKNYTLLYFDNTNQTLNLEKNHWENLSAVIQNYQKIANEYQVSFFLDDAKIDQLSLKISANKSAQIQPTQKVITQLKNIYKKDSFIYKVVIEDDKSKKEIYKKMTLTDK